MAGHFPLYNIISLQIASFFSVFNLPFYISQLIITEHRENWRFDEEDQPSLNQFNYKNKRNNTNWSDSSHFFRETNLVPNLLHVYYINYSYGHRFIELLLLLLLHPHFIHTIYVTNKTAFSNFNIILIVNSKYFHVNL